MEGSQSHREISWTALADVCQRKFVVVYVCMYVYIWMYMDVRDVRDVCIFRAPTITKRDQTTSSQIFVE